MAWVDIDPFSVNDDILAKSPAPAPRTADTGIGRAARIASGATSAAGPALPLTLEPRVMGSRALDQFARGPGPAVDLSGLQRVAAAYGSDPVAAARFFGPSLRAQPVVDVVPAPAPITFAPYLPAPAETPFLGGHLGDLPGLAPPAAPSIWDVLIKAGVRPELLGANARAQASAARYIAEQITKGEPFTQAIEDVTGTPHMTDLEAAAALANEPFRIAGEELARAVNPATQPLIDRLPDWAQGPAETARQFVTGSVPYAVGGPLTMAALGLQVGAVADDWRTGKLSDEEAAKELGLLVGPLLAAPALRLIARGANALGTSAAEWLRTPAGQRVLARLSEETGGEPPPGHPMRSVRQVEAEIAQAEREFDAALGADRRAALLARINELQQEKARLENAPLVGQSDMFGGVVEAPPPAPEAPRVEQRGLFEQEAPEAPAEPSPPRPAAPREPPAPLAMPGAGPPSEPAEVLFPASAGAARPDAGVDAAPASRVAPEVDAASFGVQERFGTVPPGRIREAPEDFQARQTAEGKSYGEARVNDIVKNYDPELMQPLIVVPDPHDPAGYVLLAGHHRLEALRRMGLDAPVQIAQLDITDPAQLARARAIADASNATQHPLSLKERINVIRRAGTQDVGELRSQFPAMNDQTIRDAQAIGELPGHVVDKLDALPDSAPEIGIAAEIGSGVRRFGLTQTDAEALFNRLTAGAKSKMPTRAAVRDTIDKFGKVVADRAQADMFAGAQGEMFAAHKSALLDAIDEYARLTQTIQKQARDLARKIKGAVELGVSEDRPEIRAAQAKLAALEDQRAGLERDFAATMASPQERPIATASSTAETGVNPRIASTETPGAATQEPREMVSTNGAEAPSGSTARNSSPVGDLTGGTTVENGIAGSVPPSGPAAQQALIEPTVREARQAYNDARKAVRASDTPATRQRLRTAQQQLDAALERQRAASRGGGGGGEPPSGGDAVLPSDQFPELTRFYTTEQREIFDRINADAETQARVKGFGSVRRAIEAGADPAAPLLAKARAATQRLLSPLYYVRNANVLRDEHLGTIELAHARQLAVGAQDAQMIAIRLGEKGDEAGAFLTPKEWAARYRGPEAATPQQQAIIGYIGDVIERPQFYAMPERTRAFLRANQRFLLSRLRYAKSQGVDINEFQGEFATHVYKEPKGKPAPAGARGGVGAKQATQKTRLFGSYWDAAAKGLEPEFVAGAEKSQRGVFEALTRTHQAQLQKAISDRELIAQIKASELRSTKPRRGFRQTSVPGLAGSYFPNDVAHAIEDAIAPEGRSLFERVALLPSDLAKTTMATLDASPLVGIQGVRRFLENPIRALADVPKATQLVVFDDAWRAWLIAHEDVMRQAAADGLNTFQRFNVTTEGASPSLIAHVPLLGKIESTVNERFYERGVALYKVLSYSENKAQVEFGQKFASGLLPGVKRRLAAGETPGQIAAQHVNNVYGGLERALRGQSRGYQAFERFMLFAPDFLRAQTGLVAHALTKPLTPQGAASLRFMLGATIISAGVAELGTQAASGGRKHANLTDPTLGDWMTIKTPAGNISFMGPLRTYLRTGVNAARDVKSGDFERALGEGEFFGVTRLGPVPASVRAQLTNRDVLGRPVSTARPNSLRDIGERALYTARSVTPFGVQQTMESIGKGGAAPLGIALVSAFGFSIFPERVRTSVDEAARADFGRRYTDLSPGERAQLLADHPDVRRAFEELDQETKAKADAGDPIATVLQSEKAAQDRYAATLQQIETLPPDQWREQYAQARDDRLAALDALRRTDARPVREFFERLDARKPGSPRVQVLHDYFAIYDEYEDPETGRVDPARQDALNTALDAFEARLSPEQQEQLQQDLGAHDTPRQAEYRADVKLIADSGYFDIDTRAYNSRGWQQLLAKQFGSEPAKVSSLDALKQAYVDYWVPRLVQEGRDELSARADAERGFDSFPVVKQLNDAVQARRQQLFRERPDVLRAATKWGFNTLSKDEERILQGAR
ncbi:MAG TPA: ParB N-terminal domain-containing protein [Dehalococcoidia bacterium]|nr:ParB N-terminal domain-containing protein [Dehalococcoidia bacterium]